MARHLNSSGAEGLAIIGELAGSLGGRIHTSCAAEGSSFLLTFPLTDAEQRAAAATHVALFKRRKIGRPRRLQTSRSKATGIEGTGAFRVEAT